MEFKTAIFDMDGTLVDSLSVWKYVWAGLGKKYYNDESFYPKLEDDKAVRTFSLVDGMSYIFERYDMGDSLEELIKTAGDIIADFYKDKVGLKAGAKEFLDYCQQKGVKMCIASASTPDLVENSLKRFGIDKYFIKTFSCSVLGKSKDKPDIYLLAAKELGSTLEQTFVFEDSLTAIETASKIGMKTIGIYDVNNYGHDEMKALSDYYIADGEDLTKLIGVI